ncbi:galactokinase, partial [Streptomyces goshikiensis]
SARPGSAAITPGGARGPDPSPPRGWRSWGWLRARRGDPGERAAELARAVACARRAGALSAWPPGRRPGRSALVLLPAARLTAVRAAVTEEFRGRGRPVPRFLNIAVAGAARREE